MTIYVVNINSHENYLTYIKITVKLYVCPETLATICKYVEVYTWCHSKSSTSAFASRHTLSLVIECRMHTLKFSGQTGIEYESIDVSRSNMLHVYSLLYTARHCVTVRDLRGQIISCIVRILATVRSVHIGYFRIFYLRIYTFHV